MLGKKISISSQHSSFPPNPSIILLLPPSLLSFFFFSEIYSDSRLSLECNQLFFSRINASCLSLLFPSIPTLFLFVAQFLSEMFLVINLSARRKPCVLINAGEWMEECCHLCSLGCCPVTVFTVEKRWISFWIFILWNSWPLSIHLQHYSITAPHMLTHFSFILSYCSEWFYYFYHLLQNAKTRGQDCYKDCYLLTCGPFKKAVSSNQV